MADCEVPDGVGRFLRRCRLGGFSGDRLPRALPSQGTLRHWRAGPPASRKCPPASEHQVCKPEPTQYRQLHLPPINSLASPPVRCRTVRLRQPCVNGPREQGRTAFGCMNSMGGTAGMWPTAAPQMATSASSGMETFCFCLRHLSLKSLYQFLAQGRSIHSQ